MKIIIFCCISFLYLSTHSCGAPPKYILGDFVDDYGIAYTISGSKWIQDPGIELDILKIDAVQMYILGYNPLDSTYTKIDYLQFQNQGDYTWGYCYTAYDKKNKAEVISHESAKRKIPKTGCNGFPFSRMKLVGNP